MVAVEREVWDSSRYDVDWVEEAGEYMIWWLDPEEGWKLDVQEVLKPKVADLLNHLSGKSHRNATWSDSTRNLLKYPHT